MSLKMYSKASNGLYLTQMIAPITIYLTIAIAANAEITEYSNQSLISKYISSEQLNDDLNKGNYIKSSETLLYHVEELQNKSNLSELSYKALQAKVYINFWGDQLFHRYDSQNDLLASLGSQINEDLCLEQLQQLNDRMNIVKVEKYGSKDINMAQIIDTYGREPSGRFLGDVFWPGTYKECLRLKIKTNASNNEQVTSGAPLRYCIAHLREKQWPIDMNNSVDLMTAMKIGVCLPKSCNSMRYKNKYDLVFNMMQINLRSWDSEHLYLSDLYCLPDSESPIRAWWTQPKTVLFSAAVTGWILLLIYATYKNDNDQNNQQVLKKEQQQRQSNKLFALLSITNNFKLLFNTQKTSSLLKMAEDESCTNDDNVDSTDVAQKEKNEMNNKINEQQIVDLSALEGIKVITMLAVITGHLLFCMGNTMSNGRDYILYTSPIFFIATQAVAITVNSFFTITGILTSYLLFKHNQMERFALNPLRWIAFIMYRYARIMPLYLLCVAYLKYVFKYTGDGPSWDYGTSTLGHMRTCEQESWLWSLLLAGNLKNSMDHCIPPAWYLGADFQFFLVTPIFLSLLYAKPKLGKILIYISIIAGSISCGLSTFTSDNEHFIALAHFMPQSVKTYIINLRASYTQPQNRIPVYLFGLLLGYHLFKYEQRKIEFRNNNTSLLKSGRGGNIYNKIFRVEEPDWPPIIKKYGYLLSSAVLLTYICTPIMAPQVQYTEFWARIAISVGIPAYHLLFSAGIGLYIILSATSTTKGSAFALLGASFWKPASRLSLCVLLTHVPVLYYMSMTRTRPIFIDNQSHLSLLIISTINCYLVAIVVCLLFEAPIRAMLGHVLTFALSKTSSKSTVAAKTHKPSAPDVKIAV